MRSFWMSEVSKKRIETLQKQQVWNRQRDNAIKHKNSQTEM